MKKFLCALLSLFMVLALFCGCKKSTEKSDKLNIVVTTFPQYDWLMNILGDKSDEAEVTMLISSGVDLHSFQPSAADIVKISNADMFIYVGGISDAWADDALKTATNKNMVKINLLDTLGSAAKAEELVEGMEAEEEEEEEEGEIEYDEHVWLSLKNAELFCSKIADGLISLKPENKAVYTGNLNAYTEKLGELDKKYAEAVAVSNKDTLLFGDRFPFRYLADDYGLKYYAAFVGCSAETEASFQTVKFLADKVDELKIDCVLTLENTDQKLAKTIIENTKSKTAKILSVDSLQSVTSKDVGYLGVMENNLEVIKEALK